MGKNDTNRVLILGGRKHMIDAIQSMKKLGLFPIVVDDTIGAPAKYFVEKSFTINAGDLEKLSRIVVDEKISGVYTDAEDVNVWHAIALCKKTGLPFFSVKKLLPISLTQDKFQDISKRFKVQIIEQYDPFLESEHITPVSWEFPILAKPLKNNATV